jgi:hypothetical protein
VVGRKMAVDGRWEDTVPVVEEEDEEESEQGKDTELEAGANLKKSKSVFCLRYNITVHSTYDTARHICPTVRSSAASSYGARTLAALWAHDADMPGRWKRDLDEEISRSQEYSQLICP